MAKNAKSKVIYSNGDNLDNVYQFAKHFQVEKKDVDLIIKEFKGLEGRQEFVLNVNGRQFINDTCATHPVANLYMLNRFENPIVI